MKNLLSVLTLTLGLSFSSYGQEDIRKDQVAFDEALEYYYDEEYDSALYLFSNFLEGYPKSPLEPRVKYNIGYILKEQEQDEEAIKIFEEIINSNYKELEPYGGLMEDYALYKHRSAKHLFELFMSSGDLRKSKEYLRLFDKKYTYKHFCGNELRANEIYTAESYAKVYRREGKLDKAIDAMLPYIFDDGLASNASPLNEFIKIIELRFSTEEIESALQKAVQSLRIKDDYAVIKLLGKKVKVYEAALYDFSKPGIEGNLELEGLEKYNKILEGHLLFAKYLK